MALHAIRRGDPHAAPPLVLLHGFGGCAEAWREIIDRLPHNLAVIAFDLPGHGRSLRSQGIGHAGAMAKAILADLDASGVRRCHLVGHSMGGAIAALMALKIPDQTASLSLLAPGGFGAAINHRALRRYGAARSPAELRRSLEPMLGFNASFPDRSLSALAEARSVRGATEALAGILSCITSEREGCVFQGLLPLEALHRLPIPIALMWGMQDMIVPVNQAEALTDRALVRILDAAGHMLIEEAPYDVADLIREQVGHN